MTDLKECFERWCRENGLAISLSYTMPAGYEDAFGMFEPADGTLYFNKEFLKIYPEHEQLFYFFHELRHAVQYSFPERISERVRKSCQYVIMYNGYCFKLAEGGWKECQLEGDEEFFADLYLGQPYEEDANEYAYEQVKALLGDSLELDKLRAFCAPKRAVSEREYELIYAEIDEKAR